MQSQNYHAMTPQTTPRRDAEEYRDQILTKAVKAGRRTYFFDVRGTRGGDYFLTITESRKVTNPDGGFSYDRHKIFLYKEDFEKFMEGMSEVINYIKECNLKNDISDNLPETDESPEDSSGEIKLDINF